jgi:hypothetical protein
MSKYLDSKNFKISDYFGGLLGALSGPPYLYSRKWRLLYVYTFPLSVITRWLAFLLLCVPFLFFSVVEFTKVNLAAIKNGERSPWD